MELKRVSIDALNPAGYNPRKDLNPEDKSYQKIKRSIETFGLVEPIIWNEETGHVVGGHQRLKILKDMGIKETQVVVVHEDLKGEKKLNVILNRAKGRWDNERLSELMKEIEERGDVSLTGFDDFELQGLIGDYENRLADILDFEPQGGGGDESDEDDDDIPQAPKNFSMIFDIPAEYEDKVKHYIDTSPAGQKGLAIQVTNVIRERSF